MLLPVEPRDRIQMYSENFWWRRSPAIILWFVGVGLFGGRASMDRRGRCSGVGAARGENNSLGNDERRLLGNSNTAAAAAAAAADRT